MKKRGQITVFIIIGIVILLLIAIVFFFRREGALPGPKTPISQKLGPVETYIQSCVDELGNNAVIQMGQKGGYVYPPKEIEPYPAANIIEDRLGMLRVPLWYYDDTSYMPSLAEMEYQIQLYLNNSIKKCLKDFEPLKNEYQITETGDPSFRVTIADQDVVIETEYPLNIVIKAKNEESKINKFSTIIPVRLKHVYSLAKAIFETENRKNFLENMTLQLMTMNPDVPFTGMEFRCTSRMWNVLSVKEEILNSVNKNIQRVRFKNTKYPPFLEAESEYKKFSGLKLDPKTGSILNMPNRNPPADLYEYAHFFFDVTSDNYKDLAVSTIFYRDWPMGLNAKPNDGGLLKSEKMNQLGILKFLCIEVWHFIYDVSFNVEFAVRDYESFGGKGYVFKFGMPVIISNNKPMKLPLSERDFKNTVLGGEVCSKLSTTPIEIRAYDKVTREELSRVNISYECLNYYCPLGMTKADVGVNRLRTNLPSSCANPKLTAERADYMPGEIFSGSSGKVMIPMVPLKKFKFNVTKILSINQEEAELLPDEAVMIQLKNKNYDYEQNIVYPDITEGNLSELNLVYDSTTYEMDIFISKGENYVGGWTGNWTVSAIDLYDNNFVKFKVYEKIPYPSNDEDIIEMLSEVANESKKYMPEFGVTNE